LLKFSIFSYFFWIFLAIPLNIRKKNSLLGGKLRLKGCLAMCLIFQENPGSRAYKLVAYKIKKVYVLFPSGIKLSHETNDIALCT